MRKQLLAICAGISLFSTNLMAYYGPNDKILKPTSKPKGASCAPATAKLYMQFNDVKALIEQGGSMFQNRAAVVAAYEIPKGSNRFAIFAGALWMGGTDVNGQLKLAALRYRQGNDFWPGPLSVTAGTGNYNPNNPVGDNAIRDYGEANISIDECLAYDRFDSIRKADVIKFNLWWECKSGLNTEGCEDVEEPSNSELNSIYNWPAHGDVSKGQDYFLAPFYDRDGDGNYNPDNGDHPWYDDILGRDDIECGIDRRVSLYGDITYWWVFNDKGNIHTETNGDPIGMEIRAQAFAFATNDEINRMTFYNYELINRGTQTLFNTYFAQYLDADVGNYADDFAGCDVSRGLGYMYNGKEIDKSDGGRLGYGENPPAIGCDFFEGPYQDADGIDNPGPYFDKNLKKDIIPSVIDALVNKGIVYKGIGIGYSDGIIDNERFGMRRFTYYTATSAYPYNDPGPAAEYYNFMEGQWANGSEMYYGGMGFQGSTGVTSVLSDYMFPGESDPLHWSTGGTDMSSTFPKGWDESTNKNDPGDRRFVQSAGPFTLRPGAINNITVGIVYGRSTQGGPYASVEAMKRADTKAQALFDACFKILSPPDAPKMTIQELSNELIILLENPSTSNNYKESYEEIDEINIPDPTVDRKYRFEGYQIFQLKSNDVSVADINDPSKARLVAQSDIKNGIARIINFEFDESLGFSIPVEKVDGANDGVKHSYRITDDAFAQETPRLVNHKTYYYVAIAYAFNQFKKYDPNDPLLLDGQKTPYISSRLNFDGTAISPTAATPHNPKPESGGTVQRIEYGSSPQITRLDGYGNGNHALEFTDATLNTILKDGSMSNPTYDYGKGPIQIKVVDPLNLVPGYFECKFTDYVAPKIGNSADTANWVIYRYTQKGGTLLDSVKSERTILSDNEQIIPEWGISVQIHQTNYFFPDKPGNLEDKSTDMIDASVILADSSKRWLTGVFDNDAFFPTNWIRSGDYNDTNSTLGASSYTNPINYRDEIGADPNQKFEKIAEGAIAPHRLVGYQADFMPLVYYDTKSPSKERTFASISFAPSVDIVLTSDKSKWTRCPVIELGRTKSLNIGGAEPGGRRKSYSLDKNGIPQTDLENYETGMSWFPGYAVDLETGARLYMAFGENSFLGSENGSDMLWNPTDRLLSKTETPLMGGMHPIYVFSCNQATINGFSFGFNMPPYIPSEAENDKTNKLLAKLKEVEGGSSSARRQFYGSLTWITYPLANNDYKIDPIKGLPTDVIIKLRINKEYKNYVCTGENGGKPMYSWSMDEISTQVGQSRALEDVLDLINIVPNPYYAFSEYERTRLDTKVKITNLPEKCTVSIYTTSGKLVRTFKKDSPVTSLDWDLTNHKAIPVAGDVYLIYVEVPDVGTRVLKFFGGMRQVDLQGI